MATIELSVQGGVTDAAGWTEHARRCDAAGFAGLLVADHPGSTVAPFVALAAAAPVTRRVSLGTNVVNAGAWEPLALAAEVATLDLLSGGRALFGIGAGHTPFEWTAVGRRYPSAAERVDRLIEVADATRRLLTGETVSVEGQHVTLHEARLERPALQAPVTFVVGGNGRRVLRYAARHADIVGLSGLGRTLEDGHSHEAQWRAEQIDERVELVHATAREAGRKPVLEALVQHVELTDDAEAAAGRWAADTPGLTPADVLGAPYALFGTAQEIAAELRSHEARWGIGRYVVRADALDAAKAVIAALRPSPA